MELKVGMKVVAQDSFGVSAEHVGKVATILNVYDDGSVQYGYDAGGLNYYCSEEWVSSRFKPFKVTAPEFGPVPESGVMTIRDLSQMLPLQVYQFRRVEDGRAFGKVRYLMATGIPGVYWHNVASEERWCTEGYRMEGGFLMHVDVAGLLRCGAYELVPVYDYPAMPTNMRHSHTDLLTQYYNGDHPNAD